jgi:hypothetical protein
MAKELLYRQCTLTRKVESGVTKLVTWIPERNNGVTLEPGCTLALKEISAKEFQKERWTVKSVGSETRTESSVRMRAHNWQKYRQATDI